MPVFVSNSFVTFIWNLFLACVVLKYCALPASAPLTHRLTAMSRLYKQTETDRSHRYRVIVVRMSVARLSTLLV